MRSKSTAFLVLVVLLSGVGAQSAIGQQEDFEDDTVGQNPAEDFYTYALSTTNSNDFSGLEVASGGFDGTNNKYQFNSGAASGGQNADFTINDPQQFGNMSFYLSATTSVSVTSTMTLSDVDAGTIFSWTLHPGVRATATGDQSNQVYTSSGGAMFYEIEFDWDAKTYQVTVDGTPFAANSFVSSAAEEVERLRFRRTTSAGSGNAGFDQWRLDGGPLSDDDLAALQEPAEFDTGLRAFANSAGFISQESQLLFAMILIGLSTVTTSASSKFVAPGRFKNNLLMGVQVLVAVFAVIAAFLDLWMFLVAFMLGVFAIKGGSEIRNTFQEVKAAVQRQNERQGLEMGPVGVMEVQVSQERQEAVEAAFRRLEDEKAPAPQPSEETPPEAAPDAQEREE